MEENSKEVQAIIDEARLSEAISLDLSGQSLTEFPLEILSFSWLERLNLSRNKLIELPTEIAELMNLESLNLAQNDIEELPDSLGELAFLQDLDLGHNKLAVLPKYVCSLANLTELNLDGNLLDKLPEDIGRLTNLKLLLLQYNHLEYLPYSLINLVNLQQLYLTGNAFYSFPEVITQLKDLRELAIGENVIENIPESIGYLTKLSWLELQSNEIANVPSSIGKLVNLTHLYLDENSISELPKSIGNLIHLVTLELHGNRLESLPRSIRKLVRLNSLKLNDNHFQVGMEVFDLPPNEKIAEILRWQASQSDGTLEPIHEAKIIFIGESNYGKTHLIEMLREGKIKRKINTTHGIERSYITIPHDIKDIRLNIWDLGGQEFMRSTHQFFFSERTLYVLVTLARRERNELNHWLKMANQLGNNSPVLVVINKVDIDAHDLDRKSLQRDYPNILGFIRTCIHDCAEGKADNTIGQLKDEIIRTIEDPQVMPGVYELRPPEWFGVKDELEKLEAQGKDFITYEEYEELAFIRDLPEQERKRNLKLLSMLGTVVSYVDDPRLIDTNVINPQWIMDGVYAIINDPVVKDENKGRLHIDDLDRILPKAKFPKARHAYLFELMKKFNLCFEAKEQRDTYFIPDLFEDIEPEFDWDADNAMHFRYNYDDFSPDLFITKFIVEMHQDIIDDKRWRSGVFISNGACTAKVYQSYRKNYINVEIRGNKTEARSYLYAIRENFRKLHKPFPNMEIKQEVQYKGYWIDYMRLTKFEEKGKPYYHDDLDEDLPVTEILNGYSTSQDREGKQRRIRVFLASSYELKEEREKLEIYIYRQNQQLYKDGIFIELVIWENFIDAMSKTRLQDEYNAAVRSSDIFISLFFTKVGKYTLEEFETAFGQFKATGKPRVYTYFKDADVKMESLGEEVESLFKFREKLKQLGHFRTVFKNTEDLLLQFKTQFDKILPEL